jgi:hypothetical protein
VRGLSRCAPAVESRAGTSKSHLRTRVLICRHGLSADWIDVPVACDGSRRRRRSLVNRLRRVIPVACDGSRTRRRNLVNGLRRVVPVACDGARTRGRNLVGVLTDVRSGIASSARALANSRGAIGIEVPLTADCRSGRPEYAGHPRRDDRDEDQLSQNGIHDEPPRQKKLGFIPRDVTPRITLGRPRTGDTNGRLLTISITSSVSPLTTTPIPSVLFASDTPSTPEPRTFLLASQNMVVARIQPDAGLSWARG